MPLESFKKRFQKWEENVRDQGKRLRAESFQTLSQIPVESLYLPKNEFEEELPGEFPFTRGIQPTMYRGRLWTMRMYAGFATAEESNQRYKDLIAEGGTGLSVAFDLPTQMGLDSDDPRAIGEVGKAGVAIDSLEDMRTLFADIDLSQVSTSMTINSTAAILLAFYIVVAKEKGIAADQISGTIQNDILKEYIARGTYVFPIQPSMRLITDIFAYCHQHVPKWNTISISGYHIREAGSDAVQEVAYTLANGLSYVKAATNAGLDVNDFAPRLSFFFNAHNYFFEEVAKFRAARKLWATLMRERFQANDQACRLRFHTQTGGSTLTAQQIDNNVVRVAYQAMSAVLGGTQSLHTNGRDEALSLPTKDSVKLALRTQQVLALETGVADTIDPLAGSYFVENLTDTLYQKALEEIQKIDAMGGSVTAIESGYIQNQIQNTAFATQKAIEKEELKIVGVNCLKDKQDKPVELVKISQESEKIQKSKLKNFKDKRDNNRVVNSLNALETAAKNSNENLMPHIIAAAESLATLGEITATLKTVFGEYKETITI